MLRISILATAALLASATSAGADSSGCTQVANLSAARLAWAALRKDRVDPAHSEESCRSYAQNFFEVVTAPAGCLALQGRSRTGANSRIARRRDRSLQRSHRGPVQPMTIVTRFMCTPRTILPGIAPADLIYVKAPRRRCSMLDVRYRRNAATVTELAKAAGINVPRPRTASARSAMTGQVGKDR